MTIGKSKYRTNAIFLMWDHCGGWYVPEPPYEDAVEGAP